MLKDCLRCQLCSRSFSRKQTLTDHQLRYHPDLVNCSKDEDSQSVQETDPHNSPHSKNETETFEDVNYLSTTSIHLPVYVDNIQSDLDLFNDSDMSLPYSHPSQQNIIHVSDITDITDMLSQC